MRGVGALGKFVNAYNETWAELLSGIAAFGIGFMFLAPWHTFDVSAVYRYVSQIIPEWALGLTLVLVGLSQLFGLLTKWHLWRKRTIYATTSCWGILATLAWLGDYRSLIAVFFVLMALNTGWAFMRLIVYE